MPWKDKIDQVLLIECRSVLSPIIFIQKKKSDDKFFLQLDLIIFFDKIPQAFVSYTYRSSGAEFGVRFEIVVRVKARDLLAACDTDGAHFLPFLAAGRLDRGRFMPGKLTEVNALGRLVTRRPIRSAGRSGSSSKSGRSGGFLRGVGRPVCFHSSGRVLRLVHRRDGKRHKFRQLRKRLQTKQSLNNSVFKYGATDEKNPPNYSWSNHFLSQKTIRIGFNKILRF